MSNHRVRPYLFTLVRADGSEAPSAFYAADRETARRYADAYALRMGWTVQGA